MFLILKIFNIKSDNKLLLLLIFFLINYNILPDIFWYLKFKLLFFNSLLNNFYFYLVNTFYINLILFILGIFFNLDFHKDILRLYINYCIYLSISYLIVFKLFNLISFFEKLIFNNINDNFYNIL